MPNVWSTSTHLDFIQFQVFDQPWASWLIISISSTILFKYQNTILCQSDHGPNAPTQQSTTRHQSSNVWFQSIDWRMLKNNKQPIKEECFGIFVTQFLGKHCCILNLWAIQVKESKRAEPHCCNLFFVLFFVFAYLLYPSCIWCKQQLF